MSTVIAEVYDALLDAGASEEKARVAATTLANYDDKFAKIDLRLERMDGCVRLLTWQVAGLYAVTGATLLLLTRVAGKLGAFAL